MQFHAPKVSPAGFVAYTLQTWQASTFTFPRVPRDNSSASVVGQVLSEVREKAELTQEELAARAKMDRSYISDVERGEASLSVDRLLRICRALKVRASLVVDLIENQLGKNW